jgi:hypothetical protein
MSDDHSPGDARKPYSDIGGPEARHAQTHDVRREELTNPKGPEPVDTSFDEQLAPAESGPGWNYEDESVPASEDKRLVNKLWSLSDADLDQLSVLDPGTRLEQGGVYLDLTKLDKGPFKAVGGHVTGEDDRIIAKRETPYELWNRLVGQEEVTDVERPAEVESANG